VKCPAQKPSTSKQDYQTDPAFVRAVIKRWGPLSFDLAAHAGNHQCPRYYTVQQNSLVQDWSSLAGNLWLNPPFLDIDPWAAKCSRTELQPGSRILFLTPAAVSTNWFADHVFGRARVFAVRPRLTFEGHTAGFPKDMILSVFGDAPAFCLWRWDR
jgi:phage N-6-adenine-methyltransferase